MRFTTGVFLVCVLVAVCYAGKEYLPTDQVANVYFCVSEKKDKAVCEDLVTCHKKLSLKTTTTFNNCMKEQNIDLTDCPDDGVLYPSKEFVTKVLQCTNKELDGKLPEDEEKLITKHSDCLKDLSKKTNCPLNK